VSEASDDEDRRKQNPTSQSYITHNSLHVAPAKANLGPPGRSNRIATFTARINNFDASLMRVMRSSSCACARTVRMAHQRSESRPSQLLRVCAITGRH
jgi:hypothetical protein